jgi:hypothetical protein
MDWYDYRMQLEPIIPTMLPANLFAVPISMTILYQRFPGWKRFGLVLAGFAAFLSYAALPLMELAGIYLRKDWNAHFSFLSLLLMGVLAKGIVDGLRRLEKKAGADDKRDGEKGKLGFSVNRVDE